MIIQKLFRRSCSSSSNVSYLHKYITKCVLVTIIKLYFMPIFAGFDAIAPTVRYFNLLLFLCQHIIPLQFMPIGDIKICIVTGGIYLKTHRVCLGSVLSGQWSVSLSVSRHRVIQELGGMCFTILSCFLLICPTP